MSNGYDDGLDDVKGFMWVYLSPNSGVVEIKYAQLFTCQS